MLGLVVAYYGRHDYYGSMSRLQQAEQLVFYGLLFTAIMCVIGIIQNGYLMAGTSTSDAQRKQCKKLFFVELALLVVAGIVSVSLHMKWI